MTSDIPVHCQLTEVIRKMQQCQHSLNRTFAALHTWVIEGDLSSIDNERTSIKISAIAAMETLCAIFCTTAGIRSKGCAIDVEIVFENLLIFYFEHSAI